MHEDFYMTNPAAGYFNIHERWAVRISNNGEFIHANPETVGVQGSSNVTNGCINLSLENAQQYFQTAMYGDPVEVTGTRIDLSGGRRRHLRLDLRLGSVDQHVGDHRAGQDQSITATPSGPRSVARQVNPLPVEVAATRADVPAGRRLIAGFEDDLVEIDVRGRDAAKPITSATSPAVSGSGRCRWRRRVLIAVETHQREFRLDHTGADLGEPHRFPISS